MDDQPTLTTNNEAAFTSAPSEFPEPTQTVYPPVFDPNAIGDNRNLNSFILSRTIKRTEGSAVAVDILETLGYIREPLVAYTTYQDKEKEYWINGWHYLQSDQGYAALLPFQSEVETLLRLADIREGEMSFRLGDDSSMPTLLSAQFVGPEEFNGMPVYHFSFDETNQSVYEYYVDNPPIPEVAGDFYLTQEGNYLVYYHMTETTSEYVQENTEELMSIDQLTEISLPADYPDLLLDPGLPFPDGTLLRSVGRNLSYDYDLYDYFMPATVTDEDFLDFYRQLVPANGWSLSSIEMISGNFYCESQVCAILSKGSAQVILYIPDTCPSDMPQGFVCVWAEYRN